MTEILENHVELIDNKSYEEVLRKCEMAARLCYQTKPAETLEEAEKFVGKLIRINHGSIIEHESLSFMITTNIACTRELNRHRHNSPNEMSTRYVNLEDFAIVLNDSYSDEEKEIIAELCDDISKAYTKFPKGSRDRARAVLPLCAMTKEIVTMNFRQIREVLRQRLDKAAHRDIREIAYQILDLVHDNYPVFVEDIYQEFGDLRP